MYNKGQGVVEYLAFFSVIALATLLTLSVLYPALRDRFAGTENSKGIFQQAVEEMLE